MKHGKFHPQNSISEEVVNKWKTLLSPRATPPPPLFLSSSLMEMLLVVIVPNAQICFEDYQNSNFRKLHILHYKRLGVNKLGLVK